jgi:hypothetical protein
MDTACILQVQPRRREPLEHKSTLFLPLRMMRQAFLGMISRCSKRTSTGGVYDGPSSQRTVCTGRARFWRNCSFHRGKHIT